MNGPHLQFTLKVASRCNLACSYCYVYAKEDDSWSRRPRFMSDEVFAATTRRIREHCDLVDQRSADIVFHGGEPCLLDKARFARWCTALRAELAMLDEVRITIQTNGTLVDAEWAAIFRDHGVDVGVSLDGPAETNDSLRVDHRGRGSHRRVVAGIDSLRTAGLPVALLCVVRLGHDPLAVHRHLTSFQPESISYLMPDETHHTIAAVRDRYGRTPCADFLRPILDHWWENEAARLAVQPFKMMAKTVLGGRSAVDYLGNNAYNYVFVEPDGTIEGLDVLRICGPGMAYVGINVATHRFVDIADHSDLHRVMLFDGMPLPTACHGCPEATTCAGGYVPHRWGPNGFDNPSSWCPDLLLLFERVRELLHVTPQETALRRRVLGELSETRRGR
jgi:uncharacterized protein